MARYPLEKAIPIPEAVFPPDSDFDMEAMEVGDSFLINQLQGSFYVTLLEIAIHVTGKFNRLHSNQGPEGKNWTYREVVDGVRVWRVR